MLTGIFWIDQAASSSLERVLFRAAACYRERFHREPTLCLVPPGTIHGDRSRIGPLAVRADASLPPNHFWIGIETLGPPPRSALVKRGNFRRPIGRRA
jgi:hypothetical protein